MILQSWREYTADILCLIAKPNYKTEISLFSELIDKGTKKKMSAEEIKNHVYELFSK